MTTTDSEELERVFYTAKEFARICGISYGAVCRMGREGHLIRVRMGKHKVIPVSEVDRLKKTYAIPSSS